MVVFALAKWGDRTDSFVNFYRFMSFLGKNLVLIVKKTCFLP